MTPEIPFFMNTKAGLFKKALDPSQIIDQAREVGVQLKFIPTTSSKDMQRKVKGLVNQKIAKIAVGGGDGTITEVVQELAKTDVALGIIPMGTANNFATALRLPMDLPAALRVLKEGEIKPVSLGKIGDRYFTEAAGVGIFANALNVYGKGANKNIFRGTYAFFQALRSLKSRKLRLTIDGKKYLEEAVMCTVANSFRIAQAVPIAPRAKLTEDEFEVIILGDIKYSEALTYYLAIRSQVHLTLPKVITLRAREIKIESKHRIPVHADDRIVGRTPVIITSQPKALQVLVDRL